MKLNKLAIIALIAMAGCSKPSDEPKAEATNPANVAMNVPAVAREPADIIQNAAYIDGGIAIDHTMVRLPPNGTTITAAYANIRHDGKSSLHITGGTTDIAKRLELHTHEKGADGMMQMRKVDSFELKAKDTLELKPGSKHIMLFDVKSGLKEGDIAHITLDTKEGHKIKFDARIMNTPPMGGMKHDMGGMDHNNMGHDKH